MQYTVKRGDHLSTIASQYGFHSWRTLYDHPKNAELKKLRPNPNILHPGDILVIPEKKELKQAICATQKRHQFIVKQEKIHLTIAVSNFLGKNFAHASYILIFPNNKIKGTIPETGIISESIPATLKEAELKITVGEDSDGKPGYYRINLDLGHIDPIETISGVQARLNNLGFFAGEIDGILGPTTRTAIRHFQKENQLKIDEIPGPKTKEALKKQYGC